MERKSLSNKRVHLVLQAGQPAKQVIHRRYSMDVHRMEYLVPILGLILMVLGIFAAYHIAVRQGVFRKYDLLFTLSQPTPIKKGNKPPEYAEVRKIGNLTYPDSYPDLIYPFMLKIPLIVAFGIVDITRVSLLYLLITVINRKGASVQDVVLSVLLPQHLMPDHLMELKAPQGLKVRRTTNSATKQGHIQYELNLKPYDCVVIPEPILIHPTHIILEEQNPKHSKAIESEFHLVRCIMQTSDIIREDRFFVAAIEAKNVTALAKHTLDIGHSLIEQHMKTVKKPFLRSLFRVPYADRTLLCVQPSFVFPMEGIAEHTYGQASDKSESEILGLVKP